MNIIYLVNWHRGAIRCTEAFAELEHAEFFERGIEATEDPRVWVSALPVRGAEFVYEPVKATRAA